MLQSQRRKLRRLVHLLLSRGSLSGPTAGVMDKQDEVGGQPPASGYWPTIGTEVNLSKGLALTLCRCFRWWRRRATYLYLFGFSQIGCSPGAKSSTPVARLSNFQYAKSPPSAHQRTPL